MNNDIPLRDLLSNAIKFWEPARIIYNIVLAIIFCGHFLAGWPESKSIITVNFLFLVFVLAVLANVAYCAAYVIDIFAQLSSLRLLWLRLRWGVFFVGLAFAGIITHFFSSGFFNAAT